MQMRELDKGDEVALQAFFRAIPRDDHAFFKEDLDEPAVLRRWIDDERGIRIVAIDGDGDGDGTVAAIAAIWPGIGRSNHVGDLRLVVAADRRRQGLGRRTARAALVAALRRGIWKLSVEVVATQQRTIDMFLALGFVPEALLRDQLCSPEGVREDVVLLSHFAEDAAQDVLLAAPDEVAG